MSDTTEIALVKDEKGIWQAPFKIPVGRPTKYHDGVCDEILKLGALGYSLVQMAAHFHVTRATLQNWAEDHPEFLTALNQAMCYSQAWWEQWGRVGLSTPGFNAAHWKNNVYNRFRKDYHDRSETMLVGPDGGPLMVSPQKRIDVRVLAPEERETLKQLLLTAIGEAVDEDG
jgi:hypothetical protein